MNKIVLILGAGFLQKPAIEASKRLGFYTIVVDADKNAVCVSLADRFECIDLKDYEKIYSFARELKKDIGLDAIFTAGTDFSSSVSYTGEKLNLFCHSYEASLNASNKIRMRRCFKEFNVPSPNFFCIEKKDLDSDIINEYIDKIGFPCVIKPVDNMGGRGCRMIRSREEVFQSIENAISSSRSGCAILEEYMQGDEYSIDALISNGEMTITGFADRHIYFPPYFIETGHTMPTNIDSKKKYELISTFAMAAKALSLTCGAAKADIKYTDKGPMIGEVAARLSGGFMSGWTFPYSSNCNLTEQAILIACGMEAEYISKNRKQISFMKMDIDTTLEESYKLYEITCSKTSAERALISIPGTIDDIIYIEDKNTFKNVKDIFLKVKKGDNVIFPHNNVQKCGNVISWAETRDESIDAAERAVSKIILRLKSNNADTNKFLSGKENTFEKGFPPNAFCTKVDLESINGFIPSDKPISEFIPEQLKELYDCCDKDWNYRTFRQTCEIFDKIVTVHEKLEAKKFWQYGLRSGIQGLLYFADNIMSGESK